MKIYLAGGIGSDWQDKVIETASNNEYLDPRRHYDTDEKVYTQLDLAEIKKADIIFAYLEANNPAGHNLAFELGFAHALGKQIIFVNENKRFEKYIGMLKAVSCGHFDRFDDALDWFINNTQKHIRSSYMKVENEENEGCRS